MILGDARMVQSVSGSDGNFIVAGDLTVDGAIRLPVIPTNNPVIGTPGMGVLTTGALVITAGGNNIVFRPTSSTSTTGQATLMPSGTLALTGVTLSSNGLIFPVAGGSFVTTSCVVVTTMTPTTAVPFVPSATKDTEITFSPTISTPIMFTYGPVTGAEHVLYNNTTASVFFTKRIPAGWSVILTATSMPVVTIQTV